MPTTAPSRCSCIVAAHDLGSRGARLVDEHDNWRRLHDLSSRPAWEILPLAIPRPDVKTANPWSISLDRMAVADARGAALSLPLRSMIQPARLRRLKLSYCRIETPR